MKTFCLWGIIFLAAALSRAETVYWSDNFDDSNATNRWKASSAGAWNITSPTAGPSTNSLGYRSHSGAKCANTQNYGFGKDTRLICTNYNGSSTLAVPAANQYPRLRFWHWINLDNALGYVEISTDNGSTWTQISQTYEYGAGGASGGWLNGSGVWSRPSIDLSPYASQNVQLAFHFISGNVYANGLGWFVDDVALVTGKPVINNVESFEGSQGDWAVSAGLWEIGRPTSGPGAAHSGTNCAATVLAGNYADNADSRLITPPFVVAANGTQTFSFWHWYNINNAFALVEISNDGGSSWTQLSSWGGTSTYNSGGWIQSSYNLSAYSGQIVQIAFRFYSGGVYSAPGWYIDDVVLPYTPPAVPPIISLSVIGSESSQIYSNIYYGLFEINSSGSTQPTTVNLAIGGTATPGVDYVPIPTSVTIPANTAGVYVLVNFTNVNLSVPKTVVLSLVNSSSYFMGLTTNGTVTLLPNYAMTNNVPAPVGRYWRGSGSDPTFWSTVVPQDFETGTTYSNLNGNCANLYPGLTSWSSQTLYHYNVTNPLPQTAITNRIPFNNPIVAFGEREGGTPLYFNQFYSFGIYTGDPSLSNQPVIIQAYYRTNYQLAGTIDIYPPTTSSSAQDSFNTNGYEISTNAFGLTTILSGAPAMSWGEMPITAVSSTYYGGYVLTHQASNLATNYYYIISFGGNPADGIDPMVINSSGQIASSLLYSLDFEQRPPWRSVFLDQPHFNGQPLPPFYSGKTLTEMLTNTPAVTNVVNFIPAAATNLDDSPELRRHPILDNFVASMGNDPIALANYVINQIDLTDPVDYNDDGSLAEKSINPGGVARGALGTFLEKQGSPAEECALLVYLLRQAGVPAVYEFAPHNGLQVLDARLSSMLRFQVHGDVSSAGQLYTTNSMIPVNYPWVAAYIGTNWVHIFPWLKDYELDEGLNLWDEMPTNYSNAYAWMRDYIYGNTNLLSLAVDGDNTPRVIFPKYLQQTLLANHPGVSVDDIGMKIHNRQHYYARWQDFPTPTWLTNTSTAIESLSSIALTNVNPSLTNIFDTVSVEIYSLANPSEDIDTGDMRLVDLHNREFYIDQFITNSTVQLNLVLMPFRTNVNTTLAFTNDANLLSKELLSLTFAPGDYQLGVRFRYHRHRAITPATAVSQRLSFLGLTEVHEVDFERPLMVGDQAAICMDYGRVTRDMLNVHAGNLWQMQSQLKANPSGTNSVSADVYEGTLMYLAGMSYYEKYDEFQKNNSQWQKYSELSQFAAGLSKLEPGRDSYGYLTNGTDPILPAVDMFFYQTLAVGNATIHPDSGRSLMWAEQNWGVLGIVDGSAEEHQVLNRFYRQTNCVSTVRLLQQAQSNGSGIVVLNSDNYVSLGQTSYQGKPLQNWDPNQWSQVSSYVSLDFASAFMTAGPVSNPVYRGMGSLILGGFNWLALISPSTINGGFAGQYLPPSTVSAVNTPNFDLSDNNGDYQVTLTKPTSGSQILSGETASFAVPTVYNQTVAGDFVITPVYSTIAAYEANVLGLPPGSSLSAIALDNEINAQSGTVGKPDDFGSQVFTKIADPVSNINGEFYVDETDLQLPGPIPLALRRNYSSQNLANNQFGFGWKLNIMPYLSLGNGSTNIYAADMDGSVLAYVHSTSNTNLWSPTLAANPGLNNNTTAGAGGLVNRLRDYILRSVTGSVTNYTLYGSDGSVRAFQWMNFNSGPATNSRPYLIRWTDNRGNYYTFTYDTNSSDANFGQMQRIQCSNGNYLGFDYDIYGHMIDAYSGDGRWMYYEYDDYGDLVTVTLPDNTARSYQYLHSTAAVTNSGVVTQQSYSTHLIVEEDKPDGRELINAYDSQRRVTNQLSTAGFDLNPIRTATFVYSNNFVLTNSFTNAISGYTMIIDGNGHTNRYDYTNNLITKITDPLGQTIQQVWYPDVTNAPGYPRSLLQVVDKRGMTNLFKYDGNGNVTNTITVGDLTGDGIATQTATNTAIYNTNSLPTKFTDPAGNSTVIVYDPVFSFLPQQTIRYAGSTSVSTNFTVYGNATNIVINGNITQTNIAFGLPVRQIVACGSPDAATNDLAYNGNGFLTQSISYTGTGDPNVTNSFFYNERGQMVNKVDALGAVTSFDYDALNRQIEQENFDESGNALSWNFNYYTDNGEISWIDGPRFNPEDYIFYDYDGEGRRSTEIHWRSEANSAGTGVEAPAGYNQYAQTFYQYDPLGNLTLTVDPRGAMTTNVYDSLSRLVQSTHLDTNGTTILSSDVFAYEPGGQVRYHTNALGGVTATFYTSTGKPEYRGNADGSTNAWRYYLDGRIYKEVQGNGAYWQTAYDDVNRITTRTFYTGGGIPLATNSTQVDRRGNVVYTTDAGNNTFVTYYDGLNRLKSTVGPAASGGSAQQIATNFYDAAGRVVTNANALGEMVVTTADAIGRTISQKTYNASHALVHETYTTYSADHNSVTTTSGSGGTAIVHTVYTDNDGHNVLSLAYPALNSTEFTLSQYDLSGNLINQQHDSSVNGAITTWTTTSFAYDGLNRSVSRIDRDNAPTSYFYDALGDVTNRTMPGGLQWQATYNNAGQMLQERNVGGGLATRTNSYVYFAKGTPNAGLLQNKTDGRGVSCAYSYDAWLRATNMAYSGLLPEQNLTTTWQYDPRGYATNVVEQFAGGSTGPATAVARSYDSYGQVASETVSVGGSSFSSAGQNWDAAGRRTTASFGSFSYGLGWQADGSLISASDSAGSATYLYDTAGMLTNRSVGLRNTGITSRDGEGRPLVVTTKVNGSTQLAESFNWLGDGLLASHSLVRPDFTDSRTYTYASLTRRLTQERLNLNGSATWTNTLAYDQGASAGAGVLTSMGQANSSSNAWSGGFDSFLRIYTGTNSSFQYPTYGHANGLFISVAAWLDNRPIPVTMMSTQATQWRGMMDLSPGPHQLVASILHPDGQFTAWTTNVFTNNLAYENTVDTYDPAGNVTQRVWQNPNGTVIRTQTLSWDARGRLHKISDRDSNNFGYDWTTVYDALSRRLQTTTTIITNGVAAASQPNVVNSFYDPQVEFLELGVAYGTNFEWKLYGPDLNGKYGSLNGTGGFEASSQGNSQFNPTVSDFRGNILGYYNAALGNVIWNSARPTGYGAVPGLRPMPLGSGANVSLSSAWRGRWVDITGYYNIGLRPYDPVSGRWLAADSVWDAADSSYYTFAGGEPIMGFDPDGRCLEAGANFMYHGGVAGYALNGIGNALNSYSGDSAVIGAAGAYYGTLFNEVGAMVSPSTYVNGLSSYGHNVASYYGDGGLLPAASYAITSWNVGAMYSGGANFDFNYDTAGQPIGNGLQRGAVFAGGVASTAMIASGGLGGFNWIATPTTTADTIAPGFVDRAISEPGQGWVSQLQQQQQAQAGRVVYEHPDATTLSPEEMEYLQLRETEAGVYVNEHENGTYIGEYGSGMGRADISAGEKESLYSDPLVNQEIYPVPTKADAQALEAQMINDVDAANNPSYYNKKNGNNNAGK